LFCGFYVSVKKLALTLTVPFFFFGWGSQYIAQACLKLEAWGSPALAFQECWDCSMLVYCFFLKECVLHPQLLFHFSQYLFCRSLGATELYAIPQCLTIIVFFPLFFPSWLSLHFFFLLHFFSLHLFMSSLVKFKFDQSIDILGSTIGFFSSEISTWYC
jgi:hypothetical protein